MLKRLLLTALPSVLACTLGQPAVADINTWIDESGTVNVSNLSPPEGVHVTKVVREKPQVAPRASGVAGDPVSQAENRALAERVRQLEYEVELAKRQPPPTMYYSAMPTPPPPVQYEVAPAQYGVAPLQYEVDLAPRASYGCDPAWIGCGGWWGPGAYPASVILLGVPTVHRHFPSRGGHQFAMQRPGRPTGRPPPGGFRKR